MTATTDGAIAATAGAAPGPSEPLPPLRDDLTLLDGAPEASGAPTWTVWDPVRNRYFRIGRVAAALIGAWHRADPAVVARAAEPAAGRPIDATEVERFVRFLRHNDLTAESGPARTRDLLERAAAARPHWTRWLLRNYLFLRVPLVRPDAFLDATLPLVRPLMSRTVALLVGLAGAIGLMLVLRQWEAFTATFLHFFSLAGVLWFGVALVGTKIVHELAHAYTAKRFGCRVHTMGIAFLVLWPVLYTDVSDAWRLASRRARLQIGAAGMMAELALACLATLAWSFMPDGPARAAAFLIATVTWAMTLLINLNPFLKFDGYYLLSDLLGVSNLQGRSFALGRWRLREALFGFGEPAPEPLSGRLRRGLVLYAWGTWIWRFFLFIGIALLIYHFFIKVVGIFLMVVELAWFIARPVRDELAEWSRRRQSMRFNRNLIVSLLVLAGGIAALAVPWQDRLALPAVWEAARTAELHPPVPARIAEVAAGEGANLAAGDPVMRLDSPDLALQLELTARRVDLLQQLIARRAAGGETAEAVGVLEQELATELATLRGLRAEAARLALTAPIAGRLADLPPGLAPGRWVRPTDRLGRIVGADASLVAWLPEHALERVTPGAAARFYPDDPGRAPIAATVVEVEAVGEVHLDSPYLASVFGGPIAVREDDRGRLVPETAVYRVILAPDAVGAPERVVVGTARVEADPVSPIGRLWRTVAAVLIRESGF